MYFPDAIASCGVKEDYVFSFGEIVGKDSSNVQSFGFPARILDMKCIDADLQEIDMHPAMRNKTMDALVGLAVFDDTDRHFSAPLLVPVELRLNYLNADNVSKEDLLEKDTYTRSISYLLQYSAESVFLFSGRLSSQMINILSRWRRGSDSSKMKGWKFLSPEEFSNFIHFTEDYPYRPVTDFKGISDSIDSFLANRDILQCAYYISGYVRDLLTDFHRRYKIEEVRYLSDCLKNKFDSVFAKYSPDTKDIDFLKYAVEDVLQSFEVCQ